MRIEKRKSLWKKRKYQEIRIADNISILRPVEKDLDDMIKDLFRRKKKWE